MATSLLYAFAHPPYGLWPLALIAIAPASAALLDPQQRLPWPLAATAGFLFGAATTWILVAPWSWLAARGFFAGSTMQALAFTIALPLSASAVAIQYAIAFVLISRLAGMGAMVGVIGSASLWAATEMVRTSLGYGNPWGAFAAALSPADAALSGFRAETPIAGLLGLGGPPLVAFLAAAAGAAIGLAWKRRGSVVERGRALLVGASVFTCLLAASAASLAWLPLRQGGAGPIGPLRVALVQPGVGRSQLWQGSGAVESFNRHLEMSRGYETKGADLIVWPDNSLPFVLDANVDKRDQLRTLARERGAALLVGGSHSSVGPDGRSSIFHSAFLFPADGGEPMIYDKRVLLPFVEHVPAWFSPFFESSRQDAFAQGNGPGVFAVKDWLIAPLLCLEAIYPSEVAARVEEGADLLVNLSNDSWIEDSWIGDTGIGDSWFGQGAGPEQEFSLAKLVAAETSRPLVRVATTGVSALVGEDGLVAWRLPVKTGAIALLDVAPPRRDSFYVRGGRPGFALLIALVALAAIVLPAWAGPLAANTRNKRD